MPVPRTINLDLEPHHAGRPFIKPPSRREPVNDAKTHPERLMVRLGVGQCPGQRRRLFDLDADDVAQVVDGS